MRPDKNEMTNIVNSQYDEGGQYVYFKTSVYNQNKNDDAKDYVQVTFYDVKVTH